MLQESLLVLVLSHLPLPQFYRLGLVSSNLRNKLLKCCHRLDVLHFGDVGYLVRYGEMPPIVHHFEYLKTFCTEWGNNGDPDISRWSNFTNSLSYLPEKCSVLLDDLSCPIQPNFDASRFQRINCRLPLSDECLNTTLSDHNRNIAIRFPDLKSLYDDGPGLGEIIRAFNNFLLWINRQKLTEIKTLYLEIDLHDLTHDVIHEYNKFSCQLFEILSENSNIPDLRLFSDNFRVSAYLPSFKKLSNRCTSFSTSTRGAFDDGFKFSDIHALKDCFDSTFKDTAPLELLRLYFSVTDSISLFFKLGEVRGNLIDVSHTNPGHFTDDIPCFNEFIRPFARYFKLGAVYFDDVKFPRFFDRLRLGAITFQSYFPKLHEDIIYLQIYESVYHLSDIVDILCKCKRLKTLYFRNCELELSDPPNLECLRLARSRFPTIIIDDVKNRMHLLLFRQLLNVIVPTSQNFIIIK
ncbi:hypothetical protein GEMRC1_012385 [Eukaryota sp. GEM-RC1]